MAMRSVQWYGKGLLNSYSQVFFSDNKAFAALLLPLTFLDFYTGLYGLFAVLLTNGVAFLTGFDKYKIQQGYYGFNALLVGLGLGIHFQPGWLLLFIVFTAAILTLFISVVLEGIIGKYGLPQLSLPFVFALWALMLASREFQFLGLNERGIYTLNDLYIIGGAPLVRLYEWWNAIPIGGSIKAYFLSLGAIFFQYSVFTGMLLALGLLVYSRIAFTLSLLGFYAAWLFYQVIGAQISETVYSYIGFNYILTAIALGGFFIIPNRSSYLWVALVIPAVAILTISMAAVFSLFFLPVYSLPFNVVTLSFLYALKFRIDNKAGLHTLFIQRNSPEKNLYAFINYRERFGKESPVPVHPPFHGEWVVTQGHNGEFTHKGEWRHAWDFEIKDEEGRTYRNKGDFPADYYCYDKNVIAPADGVVEEVVDDIDDNIIGEKNLAFNWGNTIVIKHAEHLYTKLSHLKRGAIAVKAGDKVKKGDLVAHCGNSGNSPYPHLHFQVQATPYIGSKTIDYPLSDVLWQKDGHKSLAAIAVPQKGDTVSNIQVHPALRNAFSFVPGKSLRFRLEDGREVNWEVKLDYYLNKYIECAASHSRAYFRLSDAMLQFTHFEGDRKSLLHFFYLSAYKVSLGFLKGLELHDTFPVNQVFHPNRIVIQDFLAPFFRYLEGRYTLKYPSGKGGAFDSAILLEGEVEKWFFKRKKRYIRFSFHVDAGGLKEFNVQGEGLKIRALCAGES